MGELFSISREVKKKEKEIEKLETQNASLLSQLINISNHQAQSQVHTNVYGDYHAPGRVEKATEEEVQENQQRDAANEMEVNKSTQITAAQPNTIASIDPRAVENFAFQRYAAQKAIEIRDITRDAKLVIDLRDVDRISNINPIFDGYIRTPGQEIFLEVRPNLGSPLFRDRLYMMLSKIDHYRSRSGIDARLDLIVVRLPSRSITSFEQRFIDQFRPAIFNNILTITEISASESEERQFMRQHNT